MKSIFVFFCGLLFTSVSVAQSLDATWSNEIKLRYGSTDLSVIYADDDGVYVQEGHLVLRSYYIIGASARNSVSLIKLNKSFKEVYKNDFNKELRGKYFEEFFFFANKAYLIASDYNKKEMALEFFAAEVDKKNGQMKGTWKPLASVTKEGKADDLLIKFSYNADSTKMIMISTSVGKLRGSFEVQEFDNDLKKVGKTIKMSNDYDANTFQLEDVIHTTDGNTVLVGRVYDYADNKKKKKKFLEFQNYSIRLYDQQGKLIKEIATDLGGKWMTSGKVAQLPTKELILAAYYSNEKKSDEINGMLVQRINAVTGDIISTSQKELTTSMIDNVISDDDPDGETKKERAERERLEKMKEEESGFSRYMKFKDFIYTADNGLVILAEKYDQYSYTSTSTSGVSGQRISSTSTYMVYENGDIMMSKIDADGQISWLHVLPKYQREVVQSGKSNDTYGSSFSIRSSFFSGFDFPFYSGLAIFPEKGNSTIAILFNDNPKNENVLQAGQYVQPVLKFRKSDCVAVFIDAATGKYVRKALFSNKDQPTAMLRLGRRVGDQFYVVGKDDRLVMGKSKIAICKISYK